MPLANARACCSALLLPATAVQVSESFEALMLAYKKEVHCTVVTAQVGTGGNGLPREAHSQRADRGHRKEGGTAWSRAGSLANRPPTALQLPANRPQPLDDAERAVFTKQAQAFVDPGFKLVMKEKASAPVPCTRGFLSHDVPAWVSAPSPVPAMFSQQLGYGQPP